ncbi:arsenate reductase [Apiospora kogelbergensis]|uniref:Arsenate reductase n=1 Tax=Apiospora kogelbergensis TaxID=1337665 RepID=A0AAW0QKI6_9PEZI
MKFSNFLVPAFAGLAVADTAASQPSTEAYILRESRPSKDASSSSSPSISSNAAQAILSSRLSSDDRLSQDIPEADYDVMNRFGKPSAKLFGDDDSAAAHQLVLLYKGVDAANTKALKKALGASSSPSFTSPSALNYFPSASRYNTNKCKFEDAIDPAKDACWQGVSRTQYLEIDLSKDAKSTSAAALAKNLKALQSLAQSGKMETLILIHPSAQAAGSPEELRRRDLKTEVVLTDKQTVATTKPTFAAAAADKNDKPKTKTPGTSPSNPHPFKDGKNKKGGLLPACFTSQNACNTATNNCTGHGMCENKWKAETGKACFACRCLETTEKDADGKSRGLFRWGGSACHKQDISTPFWLLAGLTLVLVSIVGFCINLLFQVGEEPLPGVIGAGVSRGGSK